MDIGVDYYPEHWDRADWEPHAQLMQEAGFTLVRLAEFAWHKMEPKEGQYEFGWLDEAIAVLRKRNLKVILGTPTAAPPPWLVTAYPDVLTVNQDGVRTEAGGRQHTCFSSPKYRDLSRRVVTTMAQHYTDHPAVVGWQTDNEIGGPRCWCEQCAKAFREWLKARYGTTERLNEAWGAVFWGQAYNAWDEVPLPRDKHASHGPSILLDRFRFHSDQVLSYHQMQVDLLRKQCPRHFITHNCMGFYNVVDYFALGKSLDRVAWDNYPGNVWGSGIAQGALADYMRSVKHQPFMVMEQRSGLTGWLEMFQSGDRPGQLRLWSYQSVAHGADAIVYFRWRTARFGTEQYWHGILDHHGVPGRRYRELARVGKEFGALEDRITGSVYEAPVGIVIDPDSRWALEIQKGTPGFDYLAHANGYWSAFAQQHVGVEYYHPADDWSKAKVLVVPTLFLADEATAGKLKAFAEAGGTVVLTFRSGVKDAANVVVNDRLPGVLKSLAGCIVEEYDALAVKEAHAVELLGPLPKKPAKASLWTDQLLLKGAKAIARYVAGPFEGSPAAALHKVGRGQVLYVGFQGDAEFNRLLAAWLVKTNGLAGGLPPSDDVEVTARVKGKERFLFVLNHSAQRQRLPLPARPRYRDLLTGQKSGRALTLAPYDVKILAPLPAA